MSGSPDQNVIPALWLAHGQRGGALGKLIMFLVVVFAFVALAWMLFLPLLLTKQLRRRSGFDAQVNRLAVNPFTGSIELQGFVLENPPTFPVLDFLELRQFRAHSTLSSLLSDHPVFDDMLIDVASITLVKRQDGITNASAFTENLQHDGRGPGPDTPPKVRDVLVRKLDLRIDRLVIIDSSRKDGSPREYTLNIRQNYADVTRLDQLFEPAMLKKLAPIATAVSGLIPGDLGAVLAEAGKSGNDWLKQTGRRTGERAKGFFDALEESKKP
jgi:hypothetical protein